MNKYTEVEELRNKRDACSCGHKLFIIVPQENGELNCCCFLCGEVKYVVVAASYLDGKRRRDL